MSDAVSPEEPDDHSLLMECLALLLADNATNAADFRRAGGARAVHNMVALTSQRWQALRVAQQLILGDDSPRAHDDLGTLLELMQSTPPQAYGVKIDILRTVIRLFSLDPRTKHLFRQVSVAHLNTDDHPSQLFLGTLGTECDLPLHFANGSPW